jgi:tetratricopeptide (TPR) repeat protein
LALGCAGSAPEEELAAVPRGAAAAIEQAERARQARDFDAAIAAYREALEQTPWNTRLQRALAVTYADRGARARDEGRLSDAERDLRDALALAPEDAEFKQNLAVLLLERASLDLNQERAAERREEARQLAPELAASVPRINAAVERRLDLAYELLERGQLEAGIERLNQLLADEPRRSDVRVLLAQAHVRQGNDYSRRGMHLEAAHALDRAVELYRPLGRCEGGSCQIEDLRLAHHNRIAALLNAYELERAGRALAEARRLGLEFPELSRALREASSGP